MLNRKRKLVLNTNIGLLNQIITILCGLFLPRFILQTYGSEVNGLIASITQFLGIISLMELGVGAVVQSALYQPLAKQNNSAVSKIYVSSTTFFRKIAVIFCFYIVILIGIYPVLVTSNFNWLYIVTLILIMSIGSFAQYYFGLANQLFLMANQDSYIPLALQGMTVFLNTCVSILLMSFGLSIQVVKLFSAFVYLIKPIYLSYYVRKHFKLDYKIHIDADEEPIKQKWNGLAQHLASFVLSSTDTIVLSLFSTLNNVSIYSIYNMVLSGIKQLVISSTTGVQALFGNMLANGEIRTLTRRFKQFEWATHFVVTFLFTCTGALLVPFVKVYTYRITDVNYIAPLFSVLLTIANAAHCIRLPYNKLVLASGDYKETQASALIEMFLNLIISIIFVFRYGLIGVAIGTCIALTYRTIYLAYYINNIIPYKLIDFFKQCLVDVISVVLAVLVIGYFQINLDTITYVSWIIMALKVMIITFTSIYLINYIVFKNNIILLNHKIISKLVNK